MCVGGHQETWTVGKVKPRLNTVWTLAQRGCVNVSHARRRRGPCLTFRRHLPTPAYLSPKFAHYVSRSIPITSLLAQLSPGAAATATAEVVRSLIIRDLFLWFDLKRPICSDVICRLMSLNRALLLLRDWTVYPKPAETRSWLVYKTWKFENIGVYSQIMFIFDFL